MPLRDAAREIVHFRSKLVDLRQIDRAAVTARSADAVVVECRVESKPSALSDGPDITGRRSAIAGPAMADGTARKPGLPKNGLLDF